MEKEKNPHAQALGKLGGIKRMADITKEERKTLARMAVRRRKWRPVKAQKLG